MSNIMTLNGGEPITMTSLELVDFINSQRADGEAELQHRDFTAKVPKVLGEGVCEKFRTPYRHPQNGQMYTMYIFPKREACLMAMSYSYELQAKVFDRMTALEARQTRPAVPQTFAEALRLAADEHERRELAEAQRDEAIRTKALIGSKREATAMGKASAAVREVKRLTEELGRNMRHATVIAVEKATGRKFGKQDWRPLRQFCKDKGLAAEKVVDPRWGEVKAWPAEAWNAVYGIDLRSIFPPKGNA